MRSGPGIATPAGYPAAAAASDSKSTTSSHWVNGGQTKLANLLLLCRFHHWLLHEGGFTITTETTGQFVFRQPDGTPIPATGQLIAAYSERIIDCTTDDAVAELLRPAIGTHAIDPDPLTHDGGTETHSRSTTPFLLSPKPNAAPEQPKPPSA